MLKEERYHYILEKLQAHQKVRSSELSEELRVSEDTIRRDLKELAELGSLRKVHGGALPHAPIPLNYKERETYAQENKLIIAQKAVRFVASGQVIILDGGTTTLQIARLLPADLQATVFTNSPHIALQLAEHTGVEVILAGGKLFKSSLDTQGAETIETFRNVRADVCFLGVCSIHYEIGLTVPDREEAQVKRAMIASAAQTIALATAEKIGTAEAYVVERLQAIDILVTDGLADEEILRLYRERGIDII